jgi:hypothetical protein
MASGALEEQPMPDWKADVDALVEETMAFTKSLQIENGLAPLEPNHIPSVSWMSSEREEIEHRVANFRAHQQRLIAEREDYASSQMKRMMASLTSGNKFR